MALFSIEPGAAKVVARLIEAGYDAYVVGGCVRDALLGRQASDWDVCTCARPEQTLALFGERNCIATGLKHGTVTVRMDGGFYEVTTFRTEGEYSDGRHPDRVDFVSDVRADLSRRDFTINAMAYNDREGLVDPFGGREDLLERRIVRAVGNPMERFAEDALRIMRLFRFASRYALAIEAETLKAAIALGKNMRCVSGERTREELLKLLETQKPAAYMPREIVLVFMPEFERLGSEAYERALRAVDALRPDAQLRLAALLTVLPEESALDILHRLRCSNKIVARVMRAHRGMQMAYRTDPAAMREQARRLLGELGMDTLEDIEALAQAVKPREEAEHIARMVDTAREAQAKGLCCSLKGLAVQGGDIMRAVGAGAGPAVGAILGRLLDRVIRGELPNERAALLEAAKQMAKEIRA